MKRVLYEKERTNATPVEAASKHWHYKSVTAGGGLIIAALNAYGFINSEGGGKTRKISVNDMGRRLILDNRPESPNRSNILKQSALAPKLHGELWDKWGNELPSDENMSYYLTTERGFNEGQVKQFISQYRATLRFTGLSESANIPNNILGHEENGQRELPKDMNIQELNQNQQHLDKTPKGPNEISFSFPYRGARLTVHIEVAGQKLMPEHIARIRKHLELTESDLVDVDEEPDPN